MNSTANDLVRPTICVSYMAWYLALDDSLIGERKWLGRVIAMLYDQCRVVNRPAIQTRTSPSL
jgi:hypothetical protein